MAGGEGFGYGGYSLIRVRETRVGDNSLAVTPPREWNRVSAWLFRDIRDVDAYLDAGAQHLILGAGPPFDLEPLRALIAAAAR